MRIGSALKTIRNVLGISQVKIASDAGLSNGFISEIENDRRVPSLTTLTSICQAMNVPLSMVFILMDSQETAMKPYVAFVFKDLWEMRNGSLSGS